MSYFKNLSEEKERLNLKFEKIELEKLSTVRREMTNTIKKYNKVITETLDFTRKLDTFTGDFFNLEGKMEKALKQAQDLGLDKETQKIKKDISYLKIARKAAQDAYGLADKIYRKKI